MEIVLKNRFLQNLLAVSVSCVVLSGCQTWSTSKVNLKTSASDAQQVALSGNELQQKKDIADILVTEKDITDRKYKALADIEVTVNKTTIFNADPTRAMVDEKLKEEALKLNADAVILVRYGTVGIAMMSWGALDGKGRAIEFIN